MNEPNLLELLGVAFILFIGGWIGYHVSKLRYDTRKLDWMKQHPGEQYGETFSGDGGIGFGVLAAGLVGGMLRVPGCFG